MGFDFGKLINDVTKDTIKNASKVAKEASKNMENVINDSSKAVSKVAADTSKLVGDVVDETVKTLDKSIKDITKDTKKKSVNYNRLNIDSSLKVMYLLMNVDGFIDNQEKVLFDSIGKELDKNYDNKKIIKQCEEIIKSAKKQHDICESIIKEAMKIITPSESSIFLGNKVFLWDCLTIAYSDNKMHKNEEKFMLALCEKLRIKKSYYYEMKLSIDTIYKLNEEIEWLKNSDKQYKVIEEELKELEKRKENIMKNIKMLMG